MKSQPKFAELTIDSGVARFLAARTPADREERLAKLIHLEAAPVIESVLRRRANNGSVLFEEIDDLRMQAIGAVIGRLQAAANGESEGIESLKAYSASCAHTACDTFFRKRFPVRARLAAQVVYVLTHQPGFALWDFEGARVAGYATWRTKPPKPDKHHLMLIREHPAEAAALAFAGFEPARATVADCIDRVLECAGAPVELELLVRLLAEGRGERDLVRSHDPSPDESSLDFVPSKQQSAQVSVMLREYLEGLWQEIRDLPKRQALALLLNFRDDKGRGILTFFLLCGISSVEELAETMGMSTEELGAVWNELPWEDLKIANFLGCTTLDVSNLRAVARKRLARRMEKVPA